MLKGKQKKLDKNKDGKISSEDFKMMKAKSGKMMKKPGGAVLGAVALGVAGALGGKKLLSKKRDTASVAPGVKAASSATPMRSKLLQKAMDQAKADGILKTAKKGKMMKANMGMEAKSTQGYGAARTSGMGLQDENLIPGKSLDYYKDVM